MTVGEIRVTCVGLEHRTNVVKWTRGQQKTGKKRNDNKIVY